MREGALKHFIAAFAIAVVGYVVLFFAIEHLRVRKGPWQVTFTSVPAGEAAVPAVRISQPELGLRDITLTFLGEPLPVGFHNELWVANEARAVPFVVPLGSVIFFDTTVLPGTITMRLYGHEVELIPRTLIIDHLEYPWVNGTNIVLTSMPVSATNGAPVGAKSVGY